MPRESDAKAGHPITPDSTAMVPHAARAVVTGSSAFADDDNNGLIFGQQGGNPMQMKTLLAAATCFAALLGGLAPATAQTRATLDIYVVDVEGGNATLFVSPSGGSVLIDTGNFAPEAAIRDADRIAAAAKDARLTQIDHLITTHWHGDHFGGMTEVAKRMPIREYIDHGPNIQPAP